MAQSIKGLTLKSRIAFIKHNFGPDAIGRLVPNLNGKVRELVENPMEIHSTHWYDFDIQLELDRAICKVLAKGDTAIYRKMGAYSAEFEISEEHSGTPDNMMRFLKLQMTLFSHYFKPGSVEMVPGKENEVLIRVKGFRSVHENCETNIGFLKRAVELRGAEDVTAEETRCSKDPNMEFCEYRLRWH